MEVKINLGTVYVPSKDVADRDIQGELIFVPITSGLGDLEDEIFTLNNTGRLIWDKLDGKRSLNDIAEELAGGFEASAGEIKKDIVGLAQELFERRMLIEAR